MRTTEAGALLCLCTWLLAGCATSMPASDPWLDRLTAPRVRDAPGDAASRPAISMGSRQAPRFDGDAVVGDDLLLGAFVPEPPLAAEDDEPVTLNLVDVPIAYAAKSILGDIFKVNYTVDGRLSGTVTIQTTQAVAKAKLLRAFQAALRSNGAVIVGRPDGYRIIPETEVAKSVMPVESAEAATSPSPGVRVVAVPMQYVSPDEISSVLAPLVPAGAIVRTDPSRNAIVLAGSEEELAAMKETIAIFDVDWMQGMSFALFPVKASEPAAMAEELDTIFGTRNGPLKGVVRFVPNRRLGAILVITARAKYLRDAGQWIARLDKVAATKESQLHVYNVQNRTATELAKMLQSVFRTKDGRRPTIESAVAPRLEPVQVRSPAETRDEVQVSHRRTDADVEDYELADPGLAETVPEGSVRIVADDANNALLIVATRIEFDRILRILEQVDAIPNQVLIEVIVAELSLNDDLRFGVRWFAGDSHHEVRFTDAVSGAVASVFPGFSYFFATKDARVVLNALSSVTDVNVISSPSLVVLDNRTATLQVGDQVPVVVQSATNVTAPGAPIVNTVELKDTGVILAVTPRVNDSGRVTLEVEQEVSNVVRTTTSGIDSPTIRQRRVRTSVAISDGETLVLGGLMQERDTRGQKKVPLFGDLPLIGSALRHREDFIDRTELVIFIRPRVIRNTAEARAATEEFREQLSLKRPRAYEGKTVIERDVRRILGQ